MIVERERVNEKQRKTRGKRETQELEAHLTSCGASLTLGSSATNWISSLTRVWSLRNRWEPEHPSCIKHPPTPWPPSSPSSGLVRPWLPFSFDMYLYLSSAAFPPALCLPLNMLCLPRSSSFRLSFLIFVRLSLYFCFFLYLPGTVCAVSLSCYCFLIGLLRSKPPLLVLLWFFYFSRTFLVFSSFFVSSSRKLPEYFITFFFGHFLAVRRFPFTAMCILKIFSQLVENFGV